MVQRLRLKCVVDTEDIDFEETHTLDAANRYTQVVRTGASISMTRDFTWFSPTVNTIISSPAPAIEDLP